VLLTSGTTAGTAVVTADALGFRTHIDISFVPGPSARVLLNATPTTVSAGGTATLTATVTDANGNLVPGETITFTFSPNNSGASLSATSKTTDNNGQAAVQYTAGTTAGADTVRAQATSSSVTESTSITVAAPSGGAGSQPGSVASIALSANNNTIQANGSATATITATLRDANGRPVSDNVIVNFSTTLGIVSSQATTAGGNGQATATFTAGTVAGRATVTATSGTVPGSIVITITAGPAKNLVLHLISNTSIGVRGSGTNETSNLTFEARDSNGNLVQDPVPGNPTSGTAVSFTLENGGLGGGESLSPLRATAVNGQVTTSLQSGTKAGTVKMVAFIDANGNGLPDAQEIVSQAISVTITGGPPWGENLSVAVLPLNIAGLVTFGLKDTITTFLSDRFSNPVPDGTAVSFFSDFAGITGAAVSTSTNGTTAATATATLTSQGPVPTDGFVTVTPSTLSGSEARVLSLAVHPANANVIYAGTDGGGVFRTTNGLNTNATQVSWTQVGRAQTGLTNGIIRNIQIDPTNTSIIYAATDAGVFRSTGGGDTWAPRSGRERITGEVLGTINTLPPMFPLAFPSDGNRAKTIVRVNGAETLFYVFVNDTQHIQLLPGAGSPGDTVTIDYDLGAVIGASRITALALDPTNPLSTDPATTRTLYAGTQGGGIFRSGDSGFSWIAVNNGISDTNILSLVALSPTTLYAGAFGGGVFRTFNATDPIPIWCQVNNGLTSTVINTLATDGTRVYAGTFLGGVMFIKDGRPPSGVTDCRKAAAPAWTAPTTNVNALDILNGFVSDIVIDPNNAATLYAATLGDGTQSIEGNSAEGGVFKSTDSGDTWTRIPALPSVGTQLALPPTDLPNNRAASLGMSAANSDALYVGVAGRNVVRLTPSTASYTPINGTPPNQITNNIFVSGTVLFSGNTHITIAELSDSFLDGNPPLRPHGFGPLPDAEIFNLGSQRFVYTVSDQNGNPITSGSTATVTATAGLITGDTNITIPDTERGSTVFNVIWQNNITTVGHTSATLTVSINSPANGNVSAAATRTLIGPVTITPSTGTVAPGGMITFNVSGGSETLQSQGIQPPVGPGGGYGVTTSGGTLSAMNIDFGGSFTLTVPASGTINVTVQDNITGQQATATVTVTGP
jgi:adhesin/invasin